MSRNMCTPLVLTRAPLVLKAISPVSGLPRSPSLSQDLPGENPGRWADGPVLQAVPDGRLGVFCANEDHDASESVSNRLKVCVLPPPVNALLHTARESQMLMMLRKFDETAHTLVQCSSASLVSNRTTNQSLPGSYRSMRSCSAHRGRATRGQPDKLPSSVHRHSGTFQEAPT